MNAPLFSASTITFCLCILPLAVSVVSIILIRAWIQNAPTGEEVPGVGLVIKENDELQKGSEQ